MEVPKPGPARPAFQAEENGIALPQFSYGAVYFRKSNPPREDWERDYRTASEDGMNAFRHWFLWSAIEVAPGEFDWSDYDRQMDLAAQNGIRTIIAEMITVAPEWTRRAFPNARLVDRTGRTSHGYMHGSCAVGAGPGLCLDHPEVREAAERFLRELAGRYRDHEGAGWYDIWNECNYPRHFCYCPATAAEFRNWLRAKYGDLKTLAEAWCRYGHAEWDDVMPPRHMGAHPDVIDWLRFRIDRAYRLMRWRYDIIREVDPNHPITAHGVAGGLGGMAPSGADDWRAAAEVESYGYTWGSARHGDEPWKQFHAVDLARAASRGKPFWHAEAYAGPLWMAPNVLDKPRDEGRIARPEDVRYWNMVSFMCGARGLMYLRWRPLLDGPLFGAFGAYGLDGSRTSRSEASREVAEWVHDPGHADVWKSRPVRGEIGIVYVPETQLFTYAQQGETTYHAKAMRGAYQGFFDAGIQADWVRIDHIDEYRALYLPFPVALSRETADRLRDWVAGGGTLISEGCPGYFDEYGHAQTSQPGLGLGGLFGVRESYVEFTPDLLGDLTFEVDGATTRGGTFLQAYEPAGGTVVGCYDDGRVAAVDNAFGEGRTRLVGTMCGTGYGAHPGDRSPEFFRRALARCGEGLHVVSSNPRVIARLQEGPGGRYLWVANPVRNDLPVRLELGEQFGEPSGVTALRGPDVELDGALVSLNAPARDVCVVRLEP